MLYQRFLALFTASRDFGSLFLPSMTSLKTIVGYHAFAADVWESMVQDDSSNFFLSMRPIHWHPTPLRAITITRRLSVKKLGATLSDSVSISPLTAKQEAKLSKPATHQEVTQKMLNPNYMVMKLMTAENMASVIADGCLKPQQDGSLLFSQWFDPFAPITLIGVWGIEILYLDGTWASCRANSLALTAYQMWPRKEANRSFSDEHLSEEVFFAKLF